jgi:hypothetical protein
MKVNDSMETITGTLIFRGYSQYFLVSLGIEPRKSLEDGRRLHRFRNVLYVQVTNTDVDRGTHNPISFMLRAAYYHIDYPPI